MIRLTRYCLVEGAMHAITALDEEQAHTGTKYYVDADEHRLAIDCLDAKYLRVLNELRRANKGIIRLVARTRRLCATLYKQDEVFKPVGFLVEFGNGQRYYTSQDASGILPKTQRTYPIYRRE